MTKILYLFLTLSPFWCFAKEGSLQLKETFHSYDWSEPSCRMQALIEKERKKKLREYYHYQGFESLDKRLLSSAIFVSIYTNYSLVTTPLVSVTNYWNVSDEFISLYENNPESLFLEFDGDSFWWRERLTRFPKENLFFIDKQKKQLVTIHKIFYSDYCQKEASTSLFWSTYSDPDNPTVEELINFLTKE